MEKRGCHGGCRQAPGEIDIITVRDDLQLPKALRPFAGPAHTAAHESTAKLIAA